MGLPVLIMGRSGSGKSTSIRNLDKTLVVNVANKILPFRTSEQIKIFNCDDYSKIKATLLKCKENGYNKVVIDDAGYLMTAAFMANHRKMTGNSQFEMYNEIADNFYELIKFITNQLPEGLIVYITMHEEQSDFGDIKPRTIGKLLDSKVCLEGLFSIVLRAQKIDNKYVFSTTTTGMDVTKTPIGMFEETYIDNDLKFVDETIRKYYNYTEEK